MDRDFDLNESIMKCIAAFGAERGEPDMWGQPLTAVLAEDHPRIPELKQMVSYDHLLPEDLLPDAKSVVVFFIPFENRIIESNLKGEAASEEWAKAYVLTNELLGYINDEFEKKLNRYGFKAEKIKATHNFNEKTLMSRWSHRHLAWLAGLGTFGINNMLITSRGCCGRFGSFVTNASSLELGIPTIDFTDSEKCINKLNGSCGLCRKKCKVAALEDRSFDRYKCYKVCMENAEKYNAFGLADVCGKCFVGLPCSDKDPSK